MKAKFVYESDIFKPKSKDYVQQELKKYPIDYFNLDIRPNTEILLKSFVEGEVLYRLILGKDEEDEWCIWIFFLSREKEPTWIFQKREYLADILADRFFIGKEFNVYKKTRGWKAVLEEIEKDHPHVIKEVKDFYKKDWIWAKSFLDK